MKRQRRIWGPIFLMSGLLGLVAIGWVVFAPRSGLPIAIAVVAWTLTIYAGHRIWRAGHPAANVWRELWRRGQAVAGFIAALVALLAIQAFPQVVAAIVGLWLAAIVLLFVALAIGSRGTKQ